MLAYMPKQKEVKEAEGYAKEFAGRLKDALGAMKLTELSRLLAESRVELDPGRLAHYFSGRNYPDPPIFAALCRALGVSADWALGMTETELPVADLEEKLAAATGQDKINKIMQGMNKARQKQILDFAEYLLAQETNTEREQPRRSRLPLDEAQRNLAMIKARLDSVEEKWGIDGRRDMKRQIREELDGNDSDE